MSDKYPRDYPHDGWTDYRHFVTPRSLNDWRTPPRHPELLAFCKGALFAAILFLALVWAGAK